MSLSSVTSKAEKWMGPIFIIAMFVGLMLPVYTAFLNDYLVILIMAALFVAFLKVDIGKVFSYARNPALLAYVILVFLILIPAAVFLSFSWLGTETAVGFLIIAAVPVAATTPVLVDLFKGNVSFSIIIQFLTYLIAPFTLPLLAYYMAGSAMPIDPIQMFISMVYIIIIPLVASQFLKKVTNTEKASRYSSLMTITVLALVGLGVMGKNSSFVMANANMVLFLIGILYLVYIAMAATGYYMAWWLPKKDRLTLSISKSYLNGALAIVLAAQFFGPEALLVTIASVFVWYTFLAVHKKFVK